MPSRDPTEILLLFNDALNRGDVDGALQYVNPDVELYAGVLAPDQETRFVGREGLSDFWRGAIDAWVSVSIDRHDIVEGAGGRFLALDRWVFRGRDGIQVERELPSVFTFRNGMIVRIVGFIEQAEAAEAAGLRE